MSSRSACFIESLLDPSRDIPSGITSQSESSLRRFAVYRNNVVAGLGRALEEAFRQPGPAVIGVPIDYGENMKLSARLGKIEYPI